MNETDDEEAHADFTKPNNVKQMASDYKPERIMKRFISKIQSIDRSDSHEQHSSKVKDNSSEIRVFISYCWHSRKEAVIEMAKFLMQQNNLKIWIDMDNMSGFAFESMAQGIDEADVVLCFFSSTYANSPNCRREIEYAANKNKDILPIRVEAGYRPDGWLLFIFKSQLRIDFCEEDVFQDSAAKICEYINSRQAKVEAVQSLGKQRNATSNVNFKCAGAPFFSKTKYFNRPDDEVRILEQIKSIAQNPDEGCLVVSGDGGVGKTTLMARIFIDEANHPFLVHECNFHRAIWINCFDWRERFDEKAFVDKIVALAKETEDSDRSANFTNLQSVSSYFKKKNLRVAYVLDDMFNYRLLQFFLEKHPEPPICFVVTRDAQTIVETHFDIVQKVERVDELSDEGIKEMLKNTFKLSKLLSDEQLYKLASRCCGLPLIANLMAARISNCDDAHEAKGEYRILVSPQYKISDLKTQNRSFKTVSHLFTFSLDQMDASLRCLYYGFLLFNPAEPISIFDLGVIWGFRLDDDHRCGVRGICRAFEKRSLVRRVKRKILEPSDVKPEDEEEEFDDDTEDRFLVHQMLYESALEKARKEYNLNGTDAQCLEVVRQMIIDSRLGDSSDSSDDSLAVVCGALKFQRFNLLRRIVKTLSGEALAAVCERRSTRLTGGMPFLQHLYNFKSETSSKSRQHFSSNVDDLINVNKSYRIMKVIFANLVKSGGEQLLWEVITTPTVLGKMKSLFTQMWDDENIRGNNFSADLTSLLTYTTAWYGKFEEFKWEEQIMESGNTDPHVVSAFKGDKEEVARLLDNKSTADESVLNKALQTAARKGHLAIVKLLTEKLPVRSLKSVDAEQKCPLHLAAMNNHLDVVQFLYDLCPESAKLEDNRKRLPIHWAARNGQLLCLQFLLNKDPPSALLTDNAGNSLLLLAAIDSQLEIIKFLCEKCPEIVQIRDSDNQAAICAAAIAGRLPVLMYLYDKYELKDRSKALYFSAVTSKIDAAKYILEMDPKTAQIGDSDNEASPLMIAVGMGNLAMVELLYDKSNLSYKSPIDGTTAFIMAAAGGHLDILQYMYFKNPSLAKDVTHDGDTALSLATKIGHREIVQFLQSNE